MNVVPVEKKIELKFLLVTGGKDLAALFLTVIVVFSIIGITKLKQFPTPDEYLRFIFKALKFAILNILLIPKLIPLLIFPWRLVMYLMDYDENDTGIKKITRNLFEGVVDILSVVCFVGVVLGVLEVQYMWKLHSEKRLTRKKVIELFFQTVIEIILIAIALVNIACLVRAYALINGLYKSDGKMISKKEIGALVIETLKDTVTFPHNFLMYLFIMIPYYRLKNLRIGFWPSLKTTENFAIFKNDVLAQAKLQISDMIYLTVLILCLPFLHRSVKALKNIGNSPKNWKTITSGLLKNIYLDIPTFFMLLAIALTIIRVPLMRRRRGFYKHQHLFYLCRDIMGELCKDSLVLPFIIVNLISPWRLYALYPLLKAAPSPKEQRKIIKLDGLRPLEDYLTILLSLILFFSVWRTVEIISIVVTHIRQLLKHEPLTSSLFRKVFRKFLELIIDIAMALMITCIFIMLIEIYHFCRRMRTFYYLYKDRKGFQYKKYLDSICPKKNKVNQKNDPLRKINKNIFTNIAEFLEVKTLARVSQVNKKFKDLSNFPPVWKNQYESHWKKYANASELAMGDDYKELVKKGFENFTKENSGVILDEEERDYRMGARAIVLEEFVLSIFGFPHIIALPAKALSYFLAKIDLDWYFAARRYPSVGFEVKLFNFPIDMVYTGAVTVKNI